MSESGSLQSLRIFIICPGDVPEEKQHIIHAIAGLQDAAARRGYTLRHLDWSQCVPDMGRIQQVIFDQLKPDSWDLVIGVLWSRFGSDSGAKNPATGEDYGSGTCEEFSLAYDLWKKHGHPRIAMFRGMRPPDKSKLDSAQYARVQDFFNNFARDKAHPGLVKPYRSPAEFQNAIYQFLVEYIDTLPEPKAAPPSPPAPPPWQPGPRIARFSELLNRNFAGRGAELLALEAAITDTGSEHAQKASVIHGGGGHGKTTLARQHASRQRDSFAAYLFLNGDSLDLLDDSLAQLAGQEWLALGLPENATVAARRDATLLFLTGQRPDCRLPLPWLLVIDNVDDPAFVKPIADLARELTGGQIVITSRIGHWPASVRPIPLGVWEESEAVEFLTQRLEEDTGSVEEMKKLAQELGCLPLALEQAASYLTEHAQSIAAYLALLPTARKELLGYKIDWRTDERAAVATTWAISRQRCHPLARFLLRLAAFFAPEPIPRFLFSKPEVFKEIIDLHLDGEKAAPLPEREEILAECARPIGVDDALAELRRHSLITLTPTSLALHRILCFSERDSVAESERRIWHHRALLLARSAAPLVERP